MNPLTETTHPLLARLASLRRGVVSREELLDAGASASTVGDWLKTGRLEQLLPGVYLVAGAPTDLLTNAIAGQLYVDRQARRLVDQHPVPHLAALGGTTAAWLHGFPWIAEPSAPFIVANRFSRTRKVRVGFLPTLRPRDVTMMHGVPVTQPAPTLLQVADVLRDGAVENLLVELPRQGVLTLPELVATAQRHPDCDGRPHLVAVLNAMTPELFRTRSGRERQVVRGLHARDVHGFEVNAVRRFPEARIEYDVLDGDVAEELDGPHHLLPGQEAWDIERDRISKVHGITVTRTTTAELDADPEGVIDAIAARILAGRARRG